MATMTATEAGNFELVADGLGFPEGPMFMNDGSIILTDLRDRCLTRVTPDGKVEKVIDVPGGPNGAAIGPDGAVYITNNGGMTFETGADGKRHSTGPHGKHGGSITRIDLASGKTTTLYTECDGRRLGAPNDLVFDSSGGFWFTDLGSIDQDGLSWGGLYYARADGSEIICAQFGRLITPNGIGLSPDEKTLYTAETLTGRVWAFAIAGPGKFAEVNGQTSRRPLGQLPVFEALDSLAVDARGWVCAGALVGGGVACFSPDGKETRIVGAPVAGITNICFGGDDMQDVWITSGDFGHLYKGRWDGPGLRLAHYA